MSAAQEFLDRADALAAEATEGPWASQRLPKSAPIDQSQYVMDARGTSVCLVGAIYHDSHDGEVVADSEFIAASRTLVPAMSAALRAVLDRHRQSHMGCEFNRCVHDDYLWPCPTAKTIARALGVES